MHVVEPCSPCIDNKQDFLSYIHIIKTLYIPVTNSMLYVWGDNIETWNVLMCAKRKQWNKLHVINQCPIPHWTCDTNARGQRICWKWLISHLNALNGLFTWFIHLIKFIYPPSVNDLTADILLLCGVPRTKSNWGASRSHHPRTPLSHFHRGRLETRSSCSARVVPSIFYHLNYLSLISYWNPGRVYPLVSRYTHKGCARLEDHRVPGCWPLLGLFGNAYVRYGTEVRGFIGQLLSGILVQ